MTMGARVTTDWLAANLGRRDLRVVDGSWHLPELKRDAFEEFVDAHIPGAVFFDIDAIADTSTPLPHMLPSADRFAAKVSALGVSNSDDVVAMQYRIVSAASRRASLTCCGRSPGGCNLIPFTTSRPRGAWPLRSIARSMRWRRRWCAGRSTGRSLASISSRIAVSPMRSVSSVRSPAYASNPISRSASSTTSSMPTPSCQSSRW